MLTANLFADPDKVPEAEREESAKKFKQLTAGHNILSDPAKRRQYDAGQNLSCFLLQMHIYLYFCKRMLRMLKNCLGIPKTCHTSDNSLEQASSQYVMSDILFTLKLKLQQLTQLLHGYMAQPVTFLHV